MCVSDIVQTVLEIQNDNTEKLADVLVSAAVGFRETKDFAYFIDILQTIDKTLLENGVFLREFLDTLEDSKYN